MAEWIDAMASADVPVGQVRGFVHAGRQYVLCRDEAGAVHALDGVCTHAMVALSYGDVVGTNLQCPQHGGRFDLTTGKCRGGPVTVGLKVYGVKEEGGRVWVEL